MAAKKMPAKKSAPAKKSDPKKGRSTTGEVGAGKTTKEVRGLATGAQTRAEMESYKKSWAASPNWRKPGQLSNIVSKYKKAGESAFKATATKYGAANMKPTSRGSKPKSKGKK